MPEEPAARCRGGGLPRVRGAPGAREPRGAAGAGEPGHSAGARQAERDPPPQGEDGEQTRGGRGRAQPRVPEPPGHEPGPAGRGLPCRRALEMGAGRPQRHGDVLEGAGVPHRAVEAQDPAARAARRPQVGTGGRALGAGRPVQGPDRDDVLHLRERRRGEAHGAGAQDVAVRADDQHGTQPEPARGGGGEHEHEHHHRHAGGRPPRPEEQHEHHDHQQRAQAGEQAAAVGAQPGTQHGADGSVLLGDLADGVGHGESAPDGGRSGGGRGAARSVPVLGRTAPQTGPARPGARAGRGAIG